MICLPFNALFYQQLRKQGLHAEKVYLDPLSFCKEDRSWFQNSYSLEDTFRFMIKIGILRREVDGQGLTAKVRLTPLGRIIIDEIPQLLELLPTFSQRILFCISRIKSYL